MKKIFIVSLFVGECDRNKSNNTEGFVILELSTKSEVEINISKCCTLFALEEG